MKITIGGVDYYPHMKEGSLSITRSNDTKNSFSCTLVGSYTSIIEGHEVVATDSSNSIFGGIIQTVEIFDAGFGSWRTSITATGYEQIMSRRTGSGLIEEKSCGEYISEVIDGYLSASSEYSEGIQKGLIYAGATITSKDLGINSFKNIFDQLAETSGYRWWVDDDKKFHFSTHTEMSAAPYAISEAVKTIEVRNPKLSSSLADYVNRLFVVGASGEEGTIVGVSDDTDEIVRMGGLDGYSGVFGKVVRNSDIIDGNQAAITAANLLKNYDKRNLIFSFKTKQSGFDVNQILCVTYPSMGISSELQFAIIQVGITDQGDDLIYRVTAEIYVRETYPSDAVISGTPSGVAYKMKPTTSWTDEMKKLGSSETSSGGAAIISTADEPDQMPMTYYDGSTISLLLTQAFQTIVSLVYKMNYADHVFYNLNFQLVAAATDTVTLQLSDNVGVMKTITKTITAGASDFFDLTSVMPARQIIDTLFKVEASSINGAVTISNVIADVHALGMVNVEPYIPDPTRPFDILSVANLITLRATSFDVIQLIDSVEDLLIITTEKGVTDTLNISTMINILSQNYSVVNLTDGSISTVFS